MKWWQKLLASLAVVIGAQILGQLVGCASTPEPKDPTDELIDKCLAEARAAHYLDHVSAEEAGRIYDACIADGGAGDAR
jgi:hypothetical protein